MIEVKNALAKVLAGLMHQTGFGWAYAP